ncbi:cytochrome P450 [Kibdelosporangium banguiense]|uniref:Cytochrome P450 n=1 Tax=Kibdelosporangium banguiense TaxID=1365924 RepID=A0ABS4TYD0_9PSEU|nr:cytochrome P450 [Kibdelosporangium banguiense]MBP2329404.1 cytochrome P450 [Kibdelosporangium banguiense]
MPAPRSLEAHRDPMPGDNDPLGIRSLLTGLNLLRSPLAFLREVREQHGVLSAVPARRPRTVFALGPEQARQVLTRQEFHSDSFRHLRLPPGSPMMLLTSGLLRLNGAVHRRHRQAMQTSFSPRHVRVYTGTIVTMADEMIRDWQPGEAIDLHKEFATLVTRVSLSTMAGLDDRAKAGRLHDAMAALAKAASHPLTSLVQKPLPGTPFRRMSKLADEVEQTLRDLVKARQDQLAAPDLLGMLSSRDENAADSLSESEIIGEAYTALCHDSVASALFWTLVLLDQHREWRARLVKEIARTAGTVAPAPELFDDMPVLDFVVKESLRLIPPASFAIRYATEGASIDGHRIPAGAMVVVSAFVTHREKDSFPDPLRFDPGRWQNNRPAQHIYFPFGLGTHSCIGRSLALLEIKVVLTRILQQAPLALAGDTVIDPVVRISTVPAEPVQALVLSPGAAVPPRHTVTGSLTDVIDLPA